MKRIKVIYAILLLYIIAAIVFWGHSLQKQNDIIATYQLEIALQKKNNIISDALYLDNVKEIEKKRQSRTRQYIGEGITFLLVILIGASIVYASIQRQKKLTTQQRNFILSITHELKTPIAGIKLNLQTLQRPTLPDDKRNVLLDRAIQESNRLNDLCNNLLLAAQIDDKQHAMMMGEVNISDIILDSVKTFESRYNIQIQKNVTPEIYIHGESRLLHLVVNNLLDNALKYTKQPKEISVGLIKNNDGISLSIADNGIGIADEDKKKVFHKFYRIGNEDTRHTKGTGLGLYLIGEIIKLHNGTITIRDNEPQGSIFEINFTT